VCGRTACTDRCGGERKPDQSGQDVPRGPGASRRPYNTDRDEVGTARPRRLKAVGHPIICSRGDRDGVGDGGDSSNLSVQFHDLSFVVK